MNGKTQNDLFRMITWLLIGLLFYALAYALGNSRPIPQLVCQKLGNVLTFAWIGYWIARMGVGRVRDLSPPGDKQARAIVIVGAIIAGAMGL